MLRTKFMSFWLVLSKTLQSIICGSGIAQRIWWICCRPWIVQLVYEIETDFLLLHLELHLSRFNDPSRLLLFLFRCMFHSIIYVSLFSCFFMWADVWKYRKDEYSCALFLSYCSAPCVQHIREWTCWYFFHCQWQCNKQRDGPICTENVGCGAHVEYSYVQCAS